MKYLLLLLFFFTSIQYGWSQTFIKSFDSTSGYSRTDKTNITASQVGDKRALDISLNLHADAFDRLRTSSPDSLHENKAIHGLNTITMSYLTSGTLSYVTWDDVASTVKLQVGTDSGAYAIRQSNKYYSYQPGKSQLVAMTGVLATGKSNLVQRIGYFDADDGLFLEYNNTTAYLVKRTSTTGSIVDTPVSQSNWNLDKLDGTGPSGITMDWSKAFILIIDFQWLGVGRVRYGFDLDGHIVYAHELLHANNVTAPYMARGSLPVRYEIRNTGVTSGTSILREICQSVMSEGGYDRHGIEYAVSNLTTARSLTTAYAPMLLVCPTQYAGASSTRTNRKIMKILSSSVFNIGNQNVHVQLRHHHHVSSITGTKTSYNDFVDVYRDVTAITSGDTQVIDSYYIGAGTGGRGIGFTSSSSLEDVHAYFSNNLDITKPICVAVWAATLSATSTATATINFSETE